MVVVDAEAYERLAVPPLIVPFVEFLESLRFEDLDREQDVGREVEL